MVFYIEGANIPAKNPTKNPPICPKKSTLPVKLNIIPKRRIIIMLQANLHFTGPNEKFYLKNLKLTNLPTYKSNTIQ